MPGRQAERRAPPRRPSAPVSAAQSSAWLVASLRPNPVARRMPFDVAQRKALDFPLTFALSTLYHRPVMLPARRTDPGHDLALQTVLDSLTGGSMQRPDSPDAWITAIRRLPPQPASFAPFPDRIDERLHTALRDRGIEQLYTHQAEAIEHVLSGRHVVITTPTASGKTLCYNA